MRFIFLISFVGEIYAFPKGFLEQIASQLWQNQYCVFGPDENPPLNFKNSWGDKPKIFQRVENGVKVIYNVYILYLSIWLKISWMIILKMKKSTSFIFSFIMILKPAAYLWFTYGVHLPKWGEPMVSWWKPKFQNSWIKSISSLITNGWKLQPIRCQMRLNRWGRK